MVRTSLLASSMSYMTLSIKQELIDITDKEILICANWLCKKELGEFEKSRIGRKFNKWRFCPKCRRNHYIQQIECVQCNLPIRNNGQTHFCKKCTKFRQRERSRRSHTKRRELEGGVYTPRISRRTDCICIYTKKTDRRTKSGFTERRNPVEGCIIHDKGYW